jgi:hypothetical protein
MKRLANDQGWPMIRGQSLRKTSQYEAALKKFAIPIQPPVLCESGY